MRTQYQSSEAERAILLHCRNIEIAYKTHTKTVQTILLYVKINAVDQLEASNIICEYVIIKPKIKFGNNVQRILSQVHITVCSKSVKTISQHSKNHPHTHAHTHTHVA